MLSKKELNSPKQKNCFDILGVKIHSTPKVSLLRQVRKNVSERNKISIVTPNPEIIIKAQSDNKLENILNSVEFSIPDGIGIVAAVKYLSLPAPSNIFLKVPVIIVQGLIIGTAVLINQEWLSSEIHAIKGRELFMELIKIANKKRWRIYLIGGEGGVAQKSAVSLSRNFKTVSFKYSDGPKLNSDGQPINQNEKDIERKCINDINQFKPHILFIGFGAPKQEKWMVRWLKKVNIGGAMVVGGTYDYMAKKTKLPPSIFTKFGLEWLWRLLTGSQKLSRIFNAIITFPLKIFLFKLKS